jgi:hypothetical protein
MFSDILAISRGGCDLFGNSSVVAEEGSEECAVRLLNLIESTGTLLSIERESRSLSTV